MTCRARSKISDNKHKKDGRGEERAQGSHIACKLIRYYFETDCEVQGTYCKPQRDSF